MAFVDGWVLLGFTAGKSYGGRVKMTQVRLKQSDAGSGVEHQTTEYG